MKLYELEMFMESIDGFDEPKIQLEQYETGHHIGARMLFTMNSFGDIQDQMIIDLGTGCGRLGLTCAYLNAAYVLGVDVDSKALQKCMDNYRSSKDNHGEEEEENSLNNFDVLCADILDDNIWTNFTNKFDVCIMNPPFGTKNNQGIDIKFLGRALQLSTKAVYSLHKTSTRQYILKKAKDFGAKGEVIAQLRYDLPQTYKFHRKQSKDINVDFYRFIPL